MFENAAEVPAPHVRRPTAVPVGAGYLQALLAMAPSRSGRLNTYNDTYGHVAGDEVLRDVATIMQSTVRRSTDTVARFTGGTLAMLLPDTDSAIARSLADRVRVGVAARAIALGSAADGIVSVNIGVSDLRGGESAGALVASAQRHLQDVKVHGRADRRQTATVL